MVEFGRFAICSNCVAWYGVLHCTACFRSQSDGLFSSGGAVCPVDSEKGKNSELVNRIPDHQAKPKEGCEQTERQPRNVNKPDSDDQISVLKTQKFIPDFTSPSDGGAKSPGRVGWSKTDIFFSRPLESRVG